MEKILAKFIIFDTKELFTAYLNKAESASDGYYGNIPAYSLVFIKDTREFWNNGTISGLIPPSTSVNLVLSSTTNGSSWKTLYFGGYNLLSLVNSGNYKSLSPTFRSINLTGSIPQGYVLATSLELGDYYNADDSSNNPTFRALISSDIPNLAASKITSGTFDSSRLPLFTTCTSSADGKRGAIPGPEKSFAESTSSTYLGADAKWHTLGTMAFLDANNFSAYTLPTASTSALGGIKIWKDTTGYTVTAKTSGTISSNISDGKYYGVEIDGNDKGFVYVPWTDTHYASKNVVGSSTATSNTTSALTNGNVYLNSIENEAVTSTHKISGSDATTVTTDASGNIIISSTDTTYNAATTSTLGLLKVSNKLSTAQTLTSSNGTTTNRYYGVQMDSDGVAFVNIPWTDTTYTSLKNPNSLTIKYSTGTTEGTNLWTYDGSATKTITLGTNAFNSTSYIPLAGTSTSAPITGTLYIKDTNGLYINSTNVDLNIWHIVGNAGSWNSEYGFNLQYLGTGSDDNNDLVLWAHNTTGTHAEVYRVHQSGQFIFKSTPKVGTTNISLSGHTHNYAGSSSAGGAANSVANSLTITKNSGTTEGTDKWTFNGSAAKSINLGTNAFSSTSYLPLSAGDSYPITDRLVIKCVNDRKFILNDTDGEKWSLISFTENGTEYGYLGTLGNEDLYWSGYKILTSANYTSYVNSTNFPILGKGVDDYVSKITKTTSSGFTPVKGSWYRVAKTVANSGRGMVSCNALVDLWENGTATPLHLQFNCDVNIANVLFSVIAASAYNNQLRWTKARIVYNSSWDSSQVAYLEIYCNAVIQDALSHTIKVIGRNWTPCGMEETTEAYVENLNAKKELNIKLGGISSTYFVGNLIGNADTATKLATARTLKVSLGSTSASTGFDGSANITDIGVSGTLAAGNGGTGATSLQSGSTTNGTVNFAVSNNVLTGTVYGLGSRAYDSTSYLPLAGGTMTGSISLGTSSNRILGLKFYTASTSNAQTLVQFYKGDTANGVIGYHNTGDTNGAIYLIPTVTTSGKTDYGGTDGLYLGGNLTIKWYNKAIILEGDSRLTNARTPTSHTQSYTTLTGSGTTANQAIVSSGTANGWTLKTLGSRAFDSTDYLPLSGGTMTGVLGLKAGTYEANNSYTYPGGGYRSVTNPNIRLIGDSTYGLSTIEFLSLKGETSINKPSDCAYIQFLPYGSTAVAIGNAPTLNTSGESNRLIIGVNNDSGDQVWLQTPGTSDLKNVVGANVYTVYTSGNLSPLTTSSTITIAGTSVSLNGGSISASTIGNALTSSAPAAYASSAGNANTVDTYHIDNQIPYGSSGSCTLAIGNITSNYWYVTINTTRTYSNTLEKYRLSASYSNVSGVVYLDIYHYSGTWRCFTTSYNGSNIKGICIPSSNTTTIYVKLAKPVDYYAGSAPDGSFSIFGIGISSVTASATAPSGITFTDVTPGAFTNLNVNTATSASSASTCTGNSATATTATNATYLSSSSFSKGSATNPVYFSGGVPVACTYSLNKTVPSDAVFTDHTYNFSGTTFYSGQSDTAEHNANNITYNGHYYYTSNGPATTLGASTSDGAIYSQAYSTSWVGQIALDYRNGRLFVRGKNNGTWQDWKRIALTGESLPASDVYSWAKASTKPSYSYGDGYLSGFGSAATYNADITLKNLLDSTTVGGFGAYGGSGRWYCVAEMTISNSSNATATFMVTGTHSYADLYGIILLSSRQDSGTPNTSYFNALVTHNLTLTNIYATYTYVSNIFTLKLWAYSNGWSAYEFTRLSYSGWAFPITKGFTVHNAHNTTDGYSSPQGTKFCNGYPNNLTIQQTATYATTAGTSTNVSDGYVSVRSNNYKHNSTYGILMNNSDIIGANSIYFDDLCDSAVEGIHFYRSSSTAGNYDSIWAQNGTLYFTPNHAAGSGGTNYTVYHSGNIPTWNQNTTGTAAGLSSIIANDKLPARLRTASYNETNTVNDITTNGWFIVNSLTNNPFRTSGNADYKLMNVAYTGASTWNSQLAFDYYANSLAYRRQSGSTWLTWNLLLHSGNYTSYINSTNFPILGHSHSDYVTSIGTSGTTLTWAKGGTALTAITVPYATSAGSASTATSATYASRPNVSLGISTLINAGYLASDYTGSYNTEEFLKALAKWLYANHAGYSVFGTIAPNARGFYTADIYSSGTDSTTGLPVHITIHYYPHGGSIINCGTSYSTWYYNTVAKSGESLPASDVYAWAKASSKPSYTASEVGLGNVANQGANYYTQVYNSSSIGNSSSVTFTNLAAKGNSSVGMIYASTDNPTGGSSWCHTWSLAWTSGTTSSWVSLIALGTGLGYGMWYRCTSGNIASLAWIRVLDSNNSSVSLSGSTLSVKMNGTTQSLTNTWRGMLNNLTTSTSTTSDSLSAYQGYLLANGSARDSTKLSLSGGTMTFSSDATLQFYGLTNTTYGTETVAIQTCFDGQTPSSSGYTSSYSNRCNLLLLPRGGQVYIGNNLTSVGDTTYKLNVNGSVSATAFYASSDIRYKSIQNQIIPAIESIASLPIFTYKWKNREDDILHIGSSAQAVEKILPELVSGNNFKSLDYATLGTIASIQAAREIVKLKEKVKELEQIINEYRNNSSI